jgi:hypothetical protein
LGHHALFTLASAEAWNPSRCMLCTVLLYCTALLSDIALICDVRWLLADNCIVQGTWLVVAGRMGVAQSVTRTLILLPWCLAWPGLCLVAVWLKRWAACGVGLIHGPCFVALELSLSWGRQCGIGRLQWLAGMEVHCTVDTCSKWHSSSPPPPCDLAV